MLEVFGHLNYSANVEIVVVLPDNLPPVMVDENRLIQILFNLLGNAMKFTEQGQVRLSAVELERDVKILVEDTGIGMTQAQQARLFQAFAQGSAEISRQYGGSGLGLFISRHLLERMNGRLSHRK